ncbi:MAG: hypothetical protein J2P25_15905 [Nocardiopsaceae bacterium]|nr:hypothetical protein [Nocardiopsaceae bacterium]
MPFNGTAEPRRFAPGEVVEAREPSPDPDADVEIWTPCECGVGPLKTGPGSRDAGSARCGACADTGWVLDRRELLMTAMPLPYVVAAPGVADRMEITGEFQGGPALAPVPACRRAAEIIAIEDEAIAIEDAGEGEQGVGAEADQAEITEAWRGHEALMPFPWEHYNEGPGDTGWRNVRLFPDSDQVMTPRALSAFEAEAGAGTPELELEAGI